MRMPRPAPLAIALLLAGCQATSRGEGDALPPERAGADTGADAAQAPARETVIRGEATYRERVKMPPGASLTVELLAVDAATPRVLASAKRPDVAGPPIPFSLPYDAARVPAAGRYALHAELVGPDGERWFATPSPVPVVPGKGEPVVLMLHRASGRSAAARDAKPGGAHHWECGELGLMSRHPAGAGTVRLDANARSWALPLARSASGARYADATGNEFWTKGANGHLRIDGEPARDCVQARQASPWNQALLRGVAFRAVGNEPDWFVEVDQGPTPHLRASLDYGERELDLIAKATASGFAARAGAEDVRLVIERRTCVDGMSGQRFEATATLQVGTRRYAGCGGWLGE
ncbi:MAG: YbaY family lipoprotein [Pseudomonadota bacterium]